MNSIRFPIILLNLTKGMGPSEERRATRSRWLSPSERTPDQELERLVRGLYRYERVEEPRRPLGEERFRGDATSEIALGYTDEQALAEAERCMQCQDAPCVAACPANLNVPGYCRAIVEGDLKRGLQIIMDIYPLPGTCGRICPHPCTEACLKGVEGEPINIPRLRRYLADRVDQRELEYNIPGPTGKKVALIGSGPASLTCAYHLLRRGHKVVVFEKEGKPGGTLNILPDYRLPNEVLQREIEVLRWLGVEIRTNSPIEGEGCLDELLEEYDAVFIGTGAIGSWKLDIPGKELEGSLTALEYLRAVDRGEEVPLGRSTAVIGGGDVAMDAVRTAMRQVEEVHFVYRRTPQEMPATGDEVIELGEEITLKELHHLEEAFAAQRRWEMLGQLKRRWEHLTQERRREIYRQVIREMKEDLFAKVGEGGARVKIHFLTQPVEILSQDGRVSGLKCLRMKLGEPDESGRRRPVPIEGSEFVIPCESVIFAIGQNVESGWLGERSGVELKKWGEIIVDPKTQATSRERVFAGGDAVRGPATMIEAIADGKRAALAIDRLLRG